MISLLMFSSERSFVKRKSKRPSYKNLAASTSSWLSAPGSPPDDCLLIPKVNYRTVYPDKIVSLTACLLVCFWESCELLHLRGVLNFFLFFRSELATEVVLLWQFAWMVKFTLRMLIFMTHFGESNIWQQKLFLSLTRIDFAVGLWF